MFSDTTGEIDCTSLLWSSITEIIKLVELYLGNGLEVLGCSAVTLGEETVHSLLWSPAVKVIDSVVLYFGDGLEMAGHLVITLG